MILSKLGLLFVIFVDVAGQGLILPLVNALAMDQEHGLLPPGTSEAMRHFSFGLIIGVFYLSWFLGAVYISKLSDSIGRKNGMLVCLAGALVGYALSILAVLYSSLWLMVLGRAITGFTSGNQPIAQAAMVDLSRDDAEKTRNLGYCVAALSVGLIGGPLIAGVLSDPQLIGRQASLNLPFYAAMGLVLVAAALIVFGFDDKLATRVPLRIRPAEVFLQLWRIGQVPSIWRISVVYFCFMLAWNTAYIFADNYLSSRFSVGTLGASIALVMFGVGLILASTFLVGFCNRRFSKRAIVAGTSTIMLVGSLTFVGGPSADWVFIGGMTMAAAFAVGYAVLLSIYSAGTDASDQGWVMGVSTALWTLGAGLTSLIGGELMGLDLAGPYILAACSAALALLLMAVCWRSPEMWRITGREAVSPRVSPQE